jgi:hypothetical protein
MRIFDEIIELFIVVATLENRFVSCRDLNKRIKNELDLGCCKSNVAKIRRKVGFKYLWSIKTEKLSEHHINARYEFAKQIQKDPCFDLPWIVSDESSFIMNPMPRKLYRFTGENSAPVFQSFSGYPKKIMVWGAIGPNYKSPLVWIKGKTDSEAYCNALESKSIFPNLHEQFPQGFIFQQDGARPHTSRFTLKYLEEKNAKLIPNGCGWPASSPDLSPIEHVWGYIEHRLVTETLQNETQLFAAVEDIWNNIPMTMIGNFMDGFKPGIYVVEDLHGASLARHADMIRMYQRNGIASRPEALLLRDIHTIPQGLVEQMRRKLDQVVETLHADNAYIAKMDALRLLTQEADILNRQLVRP